MQFSTLSVVFFAALATASNHHGRSNRFHHRRALNETVSATGTGVEPSAPYPSSASLFPTNTPPTTSVAAPVEELTTITVQTTTTKTILSCSASVTDCPASEATGSHTVTEVIDLTTTVCPVASATQVSSSVIASISGNKPVESSAAPTGDSVLTYTQGTGNSKTVITTTIKRTKTATQYTTLIKTADNGPTTTIRSTQTSTKTVTVKPTNGGGNGGSGGNGDNGGNGGNGNGEDCPAPVTVTVALTTVTETYTPPAATSSAAPVLNDGGNDAVITPISSGASAPATTAAPASSSAVADDEEDVVVIISSVAVHPMPVESMPAPSASVPFGNGNDTVSATATGGVSSTGFATATATGAPSSGFAVLPDATGSPIVPAPTDAGLSWW